MLNYDTNPSRSIRKDVIRHYDAMATDYTRLYGGRSRLSRFYNVRHDRVLSLVGSALSKKQVLEVGCGPAQLAEAIVQRGGRYVGVDLSSEMVRNSKIRHSAVPRADFLVGDLCGLPFPSETFDVVICLGVLEYVESEASAVSEIARILRPGGICLASGINPWSPYNLWDRLIYRHMGGRKPKAILAEYHTPRVYRDLFGDVGLASKDVSFFNFVLLPPPLDRKLPWLAASCDQLLGRLLGRILPTLGNGFLMKFESNH